MPYPTPPASLSPVPASSTKLDHKQHRFTLPPPPPPPPRTPVLRIFVPVEQPSWGGGLIESRVMARVGVTRQRVELTDLFRTNKRLSSSSSSGCHRLLWASSSSLIPIPPAATAPPSLATTGVLGHGSQEVLSVCRSSHVHARPVEPPLLAVQQMERERERRRARSAPRGRRRGGGEEVR